MMERIRSKYRWQLIARGPDLHRLLRVVDAPEWEIDIAFFYYTDSTVGPPVCVGGTSGVGCCVDVDGAGSA